MPGLFGASQLGEQVYFGVVLRAYVVHLKAFKIVNECFGNLVVLEEHYFQGLVSVSNLPLDKL